MQCKVIAVLAVSGVVLGAWYMLWLVQRVFFGPLREPRTSRANRRCATSRPARFWRSSPLVVFIFWIGLQPRFFLDRMNPELDDVATVVSDTFDREYGLPLRDARTAETKKGISPIIENRADELQRRNTRLLDSSPFPEGDIARVE